MDVVIIIDSSTSLTRSDFQNQMDVVIIIDSSTSLTRSDFQNQIDFVSRYYILCCIQVLYTVLYPGIIYCVVSRYYILFELIYQVLEEAGAASEKTSTTCFVRRSSYKKPYFHIN